MQFSMVTMALWFSLVNRIVTRVVMWSRLLRLTMKVKLTIAHALSAVIAIFLWLAKNSTRWEESWCVNHAIMISMLRRVAFAVKSLKQTSSLWWMMKIIIIVSASLVVSARGQLMVKSTTWKATSVSAQNAQVKRENRTVSHDNWCLKINYKTTMMKIK